jgi:HPt (histidine-containing phosphotransfer) domain-containing protein
MSKHYSDILDQSALDELNEVTGGDPEFMAELVNTFLEDAPMLMNDLQAALAAGNAGEVRRIAHGLKSNGMEFGAVKFAELCKTLERNAADGQLADADALLADIEAEFARVKDALEAYIQG